MPVLTLEESAFDGPPPEDTILQAEVTAVALKEGTNRNTQEVFQRIEFTFVIDEPDQPWDRLRVWGSTPTTFTSNADCKLRGWAQELFGEELPVGFQLDTDDLVGKRCRIVTGLRTYTDKDGKEREAMTVKDLLRAKRSAVALDERPF